MFRLFRFIFRMCVCIYMYIYVRVCIYMYIYIYICAVKDEISFTLIINLQTIGTKMPL